VEPSEKPPKESRRQPRILKDAKVEHSELFYPLDEREVKVTKMKNISGGGLLIMMDRPCQVGTLLEIEIDLKGWARHRPGFFRDGVTDLDRPITVLAEVVWTEPKRKGGTGEVVGYNVGVEFTNIYEDDLKGLTKLIKSQATQGEERSK